MLGQGLAEADWKTARQRVAAFSLRNTRESDLRIELQERVNTLARYQADFESTASSDGDVLQLTGGIAYERAHIRQIVGELERREAAANFGYRPVAGFDGDLSERFAVARELGCARVMQGETGQEGTRSGERWVFACPFHRDTTPSLTTYPPGRGWFCFQCQRGGTAIDLIVELLGVQAVDALFYLELSGYLGEDLT